MIQIRKAVREKVWLKIAIMGPAGSGKTYGGVGLAMGIAPTGKVLVVDTENSSASYYADKWAFDVVDMHAPFTSQKYMEVLSEAVKLGYEVILFDSLSHEWSASGGVLDKKADYDRLKGEKWGNWQDAKKPHSNFKEAWLQAPIHVVATMRSKMEYVLEVNEKGKQVPRKVGLAPIQDIDSEYEFGVAFEVDRDSHLATAAKDRTGLFDGRTFLLGEDIGQELRAWRDSGAELTDTTKAPSTATHETATPEVKVEKAPEQSPAPAAGAPQVQGAPATAEAPDKEQDEAWIMAMAELAHVTVGMAEKTRSALVADFEAEGPAALPKLLAEIATLKSVLTQQSATFVNGLDPDTDEKAGGICREQYEALNALIKGYGINRDALRAYCFKAGHLLPAKGGPTLARMKEAEFVKLRDRLANKKIASDGETWSARTIRIINATPIPLPYQPEQAAS